MLPKNKDQQLLEHKKTLDGLTNVHIDSLVNQNKHLQKSNEEVTTLIYNEILEDYPEKLAYMQ